MPRTVLAAIAAGLLLGACTSGGGSPPTTRTRTVIGTVSPAAGAVHTGPTTAAAAPSCPLLNQQEAANRVGMRLARIIVLHSGGRVVGCRFYALQNSPLHDSEHLPGPHQPALEIISRRFRSDVAAHNAFVRAAERGTDPQQEQVATGDTGVCFRTDFYPRDHGSDWACAFSTGRTSVMIRTVVTSPALDAALVARAVARRF